MGRGRRVEALVAWALKQVGSPFRFKQWQSLRGYKVDCVSGSFRTDIFVRYTVAFTVFSAHLNVTLSLLPAAAHFSFRQSMRHVSGARAIRLMRTLYTSCFRRILPLPFRYLFLDCIFSRSICREQLVVFSCSIIPISIPVATFHASFRYVNMFALPCDLCSMRVGRVQRDCRPPFLGTRSPGRTLRNRQQIAGR